jgi:hypothetical protein
MTQNQNPPPNQIAPPNAGGRRQLAMRTLWSARVGELTLGRKAAAHMTPIIRRFPHGGMVAIMLAAMLGGCSTSERDERLFVSCQNHRAHLTFDLNLDLQGNEKAAPPHEADVPGHVMLARYAAHKSGALNCNHGAPGSRIGGWQAVNLTPEQWLELNRMWVGRGHQGLLPFYWCGKPNPLQKRVFCGLLPQADGRWFIDHEVLHEAELRDTIGRLNACLSELGVPPVPVNVPDGVHWGSFEAKHER